MTNLKTETAPLTENETALLKRLVNNPCADSSVFQDPAWTFNVLHTPADKATFGSLVKKGYSTHGRDGDEYYMLTEKARTALASCEGLRFK